MNYKWFLVGLCLCIISGIGASPFTILSQSQDQLRIKFVLPSYQIEDMKAGELVGQLVKAEDCDWLDSQGKPQLPYYAGTVGIPDQGSIQVELISQKQKQIAGVSILPAETVETDGEKAVSRYLHDATAYKSNTLYPSLMLEKGNSGYIGDRGFGAFRLQPFQYNARLKQLLVTTEAEFIVRIVGNKTVSRNWAGSKNFIDLVGDDFFMNNQYSKQWRVEKKSKATQYVPVRDLQTINEILLYTDKMGIYQVSYDYLVSNTATMEDSLKMQLAFNWDNIDPRNLELYDEKGIVPIYFRGEADGHFDRGDYFEFYGDMHHGETSYYDDYTCENVYRLRLTNHLGGRMAVENGGLQVSNASNYYAPDSFQQTVHFEQQNRSEKLGWPGRPETNPPFYREDTWFWTKVTAPDQLMIPFTLQYPLNEENGAKTFTAKVCLFGASYPGSNSPVGASDPDHQASVRVNAAYINGGTWFRQTEKIFTSKVPSNNNMLINGNNTLFIGLDGSTLAGSNDIVLLDYFDITYWRQFKTNTNVLKFCKPIDKPNGLFQFKLDGFTSDNISIYKIGASILTNLQIEPYNLNGGSPYHVTFQDSVLSQGTEYIAVTEGAKLNPLRFDFNVPSDLKNPSNGYDALIITSRPFLNVEGTELFKQLWEAKGHQVKVVDIQDIYDEFNNSICSEQAIKDFFSYAYNTWSNPQLQTVLLLGDGQEDNRDNSPMRKFNIIPPAKLWTSSNGVTSSDNWYACIVGDDPVADFDIARINIWKEEQILDVAKKSKHYIESPNPEAHWNGRVLLTAGGKREDGHPYFSYSSESIRNYTIPQDYQINRVYTNTDAHLTNYYGGAPNLVRAIDDGVQYVEFIGHGGSRIWADYNLFTLNNVATLNNDNYPFVASLACYACAYDVEGTKSIGEAFVMAPDKGAIGHIGFVGLSYQGGVERFGKSLCEGMYQLALPSIGAVASFAKAKYYANASSYASQISMTQGCVLMGDPLVKLILPEDGVTIRTDKELYTPGDTVRVTATFPADVTLAQLQAYNEDEILENLPLNYPVVSGQYTTTYVLPATPTSYYCILRVAGSSNDKEFIATKKIGVGNSAILSVGAIPENPTMSDSICVKATLLFSSGIQSVTAVRLIDGGEVGQTQFEERYPMALVNQTTNQYKSISGIHPQAVGTEIQYYIEVEKTDGTLIKSVLYNVKVLGIDLNVLGISESSVNGKPGFHVTIKNIGTIPSSSAKLKLYRISGSRSFLQQSWDIGVIPAGEQVIAPITPDTLFTGYQTFEVKVSLDGGIIETNTSNNNDYITVNWNNIASNGAASTLYSNDLNLLCDIPAGWGTVAAPIIFQMQTVSVPAAIEEPGISRAKLRFGGYSTAYQLTTFNTDMVDSLGYFLQNKSVQLTFSYADSLNSISDVNDIKIYRWNPTYKKWFVQISEVSSIQKVVRATVHQIGIYTVWIRNDKVKPTIDANVEGQEFTYGGYVASNGIISFVLSDANGIDVVQNQVEFQLDGEDISPADLTMTINASNLNRIPIKYQLNLGQGEHTVIVGCVDVNGNYHSKEVTFTVNTEFKLENVANYPNPVIGKARDPINDGRTRFTYILTDTADKITIKVFTVKGRLVKTFRDLPTGVGYHEYPRTVYGWDCKDENGFDLANGVYFYRVIAEKGSKKIEKNQKMAILK